MRSLTNTTFPEHHASQKKVSTRECDGEERETRCASKQRLSARRAGVVEGDAVDMRLVCSTGKRDGAVVFIFLGGMSRGAVKAVAMEGE